MTTEDLKQLFDGFDPDAYADEAQQTWGHTEAYRESMRRTRNYGKDDWARMQAEVAAIYARIVDGMTRGASPDDPSVREAVEDHRAHIDRWFYPCSKEMHKGLGQLYADARFTANLDKIAQSFARYLSDAIAAT